MSDSSLPAASVQTFYSDHHGWLLGWLRRRTGNSSDAADLAHDAFLRLIATADAPGRLAQIREPRAWLTRVAHGLVVDQARRRKVEQAYREALAQRPEPEAPSPEERLLLLEALLRIDALLDGLPPKTRSAYLLSRLEGLPYPQIAARLGVSLSSVEKYMAAAIRHCHRLRRTL